jgi:bifunctional dethiobiotin synthetase / adenosylmethionine---8-amino-7-oxononanoate aminotransferase
MSHIVSHLRTSHEQRISRLNDMANKANNQIWWPFTQHKTVKSTTVIDSAFGDYFYTYPAPSNSTDTTQQPSQSPSKISSDEQSSQHHDIQSFPTFLPLFDTCASWWTQAVGHAHLDLVKSASYAAGRYGHVMFPESIHEPALGLAERLLGGVGSGWASRVFFSDNGSTATEVALKMAFRRTGGLRRRSGRERAVGMEGQGAGFEVVGIQGGYHGDTIGSMSACSPNVFNNSVNWYMEPLYL